MNKLKPISYNLNFNDLLEQLRNMTEKRKDIRHKQGKYRTQTSHTMVDYK